MSANQRFNVDLRFLYATIVEQTASYSSGNYYVDNRGKEGKFILDRAGGWVPAFISGRTDWNRRCIEPPSISKSVENWTGKFQTGEVTFSLADTDGSVAGSLYGDTWGSVSPIGKLVAIYTKVVDNPENFMPVFSGNISKVERSKGLTSLTVEDSIRNLYNSQFVPDYAGLATQIGNSLFGTLKDVQGTTFYIDDYGDIRLIKVKTQESGDWWSNIIGGVVGFGLGVITGGLPLVAGPVIAGGVSGFLSGGLQKTGAKEQSYYKVEDYNAIPDGMVFGGQPLKFTTGTMDGRANGANGAMYQVPSHRVRGGEFQHGIYGTIEIDELLHNVRKGDFVYSELPIIFTGSPDDIIVNMLCGSNSTVRYSFPDDFSERWFEQTAPLRHIEAYGQIQSFDTGGVINAIGELAQEFGFTFYVDEKNKFSVRSIRPRRLTGVSILGTISEDFNILNDGIKRIDDIKNSYTDISLKYKDTFFGNLYEQEIKVPLSCATYYGGLRRVLNIESKWIHDSITGQFTATRLTRRYATVISQIDCEVSLHSVPITVGEILDCTGWAIGSHKPFEVVAYQKDFSRNVTSVTLQDALSIYDSRAFWFVSGTANSKGTGGDVGAFGTLLATLTGAFGAYGTTGATYSMTDTEFSVIYSGALTPIAGSLFKIGSNSEEVLYALPNYKSSLAGFTYTVIRGMFNTMVGTYVTQEKPGLCGTPWATCLMYNSVGTIFRWY